MAFELNRQPTFQDHLLPVDSTLAGWAALVQGLSIDAPVRKPSCVSEKHIKGSIRDEATWRIFDKRYQPEDTLAGHLTFALRHENIDLLILKRVFDAVSKREMEDYVCCSPTGATARQAWFLYEFLTGATLDVPDPGNVTAVEVLDPKQYFTAEPVLSKRHKVRNNLLGNSRFCPVIRKTEALQGLSELSLADKAQETIGKVSNQLVARAASFLLLADSRASFEIEGERPPRNRLERWGRAIMQAGKHPLTLEEIIRLHGVLIEDTRFVQLGLRENGVFLGERDRFQDPLPEFIGAKPEDLADLMAGLIDANTRMRDSSLDPVVQAAATAFGFVYVHPLQDGNGRLHRCLIHHVLAERKFSPAGMVFPVSSVMLERIDQYRQTLQGHSGPLLDFIEWRPTPDHNVEVLNDTADLYRYFDCTEEAEFLYGCVQRTIEEDLPREIDYLRRHDAVIRRIMNTVEMPDRLAEDFLMFVRQNSGTLSKKRRKQEFSKLTDKEVGYLEAIVQEEFEGFSGELTV